MSFQIIIEPHPGEYILKKALEGKLPPNVLYRPKMGFGVPIAAWLRNELKEMASGLLLEQSSDGVLEKKGVEMMWREHQGGFRNRSTELWVLLMFRLWQSKVRTIGR